VDPCLVTHVLGAWDEAGSAERRGSGGGSSRPSDVALFVCRYEVPEPGQPVDLAASVVGPAGLGRTPIGGGLAVLERWQLVGDRLERTQLDDRRVEYPRMDPTLEGRRFRFGYAVELLPIPGVVTPSRSTSGSGLDPEQVSRSSVTLGLEFEINNPLGSNTEALVESVGLLKFDLERDEVASWSPGEGKRASEPLFVRSVEGHSDEEGWLLTVVDDPGRGASDLYVLDASSFGRRSPEAIIHLPERLPFRSHGEWVQADRYR
jgi:carotenoid cleavage dioxygenase